VAIYPVMQWLVKKVLETREEMSDYIRNFSESQFSKTRSTPRDNQLAETAKVGSRCRERATERRDMARAHERSRRWRCKTLRLQTSSRYLGDVRERYRPRRQFRANQETPISRFAAPVRTPRQRAACPAVCVAHAPAGPSCCVASRGAVGRGGHSAGGPDPARVRPALERTAGWCGGHCAQQHF